MATPRNDTLGAKVIYPNLLEVMDCGQDTLLCLEWQTHQIIACCLVIAFFIIFTTVSTYQFCCTTAQTKSKLKRDIKCVGLCYFYCGLITFLFLLFFAIFVWQPYTGGWEYNDSGGWIYDDTPGWVYEQDDTKWEWNQNGSWQWTSTGGWYHISEIEIDGAWFMITICVFWVQYITGAVALCASYLYPFRRLYISFLSSQYKLTKNEINVHYFNAFLLFVLNLFAGLLHGLLQQKTVHNLLIASNVFYSLGLGFMMYQFNKRLLDLVTKQETEFSSQSATEQSNTPQKSTTWTDEQIRKSAVQIQLINVVVKNSLLSTIQLVFFGFGSIVSLMFTTTTDEENGTVGKAHITLFWITSIQTICISNCIFLGFPMVSNIYDKLCFLCHSQMDQICHKMSTKQILRSELSAVGSSSHLPQPIDLSTNDKSVTSIDIVPSTGVDDVSKNSVVNDKSSVQMQ